MHVIAYCGVSCYIIIGMSQKTKTGTFVRIDTSLPSNRKWLELQARADSPQRLYVDSLVFAYQNDTDGHIDRMQARFTLRATDDMIAALVGVGLWDECEDGWVIHDYGDCQETHAEREARRERNRRNGARGGRPKKTQSVSEWDTQSDTESLTESGTEMKPRQKHSIYIEDKTDSDTESLTESEPTRFVGRWDDQFQRFRAMWRKKGGRLSDVRAAFETACADVGVGVVMVSAQQYAQDTADIDAKFTKSPLAWLSDRACYASRTPDLATPGTDDRSDAALGRWLESHDGADAFAARRVYYSRMNRTNAEAIQALDAWAERGYEM